MLLSLRVRERGGEREREREGPDREAEQRKRDREGMRQKLKNGERERERHTEMKNCGEMGTEIKAGMPTDRGNTKRLLNMKSDASFCSASSLRSRYILHGLGIHSAVVH